MGENDNQKQPHINIFRKSIQFWIDLVVKPVVWVRENVVEPNRKDYVWYHERLQRVPTVDECYTDDYVCVYEAQQQFLRDKKVDQNIVNILRKRYEYCCFENQDEKERCKDLYETWRKAQTNFFIKYAELGMRNSVITCYMKQKHRLAFERRHGPVGSGRHFKGEGDEIEEI